MSMRLINLTCFAALTLLFAAPALAQPDKGHGRGDKGGGPPSSQASGRGGGGSDSRYVLSDRDRDAVYGYYRDEHAAGNCPPGLAKKDNGCLPPGQAKKAWAVGQPLPREVIYEPLPPALLGRLSPAPAGYQYVRVMSDIVMLNIGSRMVTAAIADLSRF
jgi:hypothetical protein